MTKVSKVINDLFNRWKKQPKNVLFLAAPLYCIGMGLEFVVAWMRFRLYGDPMFLWLVVGANSILAICLYILWRQWGTLFPEKRKQQPWTITAPTGRAKETPAPSMQQIPVRTEEGQRIRDAFIEPPTPAFREGMGLHKYQAALPSWAENNHRPTGRQVAGSKEDALAMLEKFFIHDRKFFIHDRRDDGGDHNA